MAPSCRALRPPGWLPQWHCGVRVSSNKKLVGFISAIPADIRIYDTWGLAAACLLSRPSRSFHFHSSRLPFLAQTEEDGGNKLPVRSQKAALQARGPRAHQGDHAAGEPGGNFSGCLHSRGGAAQARFHMQVALRLCPPEHTVRFRYYAPFSFFISICVRYWHRSLNPRKLVEVKFSHLSRNMTLQRTMKLYRLPDVKLLISLDAGVCCSLPRHRLTQAPSPLPFAPIKSTKTPGLRPMERRDIPQVTQLLQKYLKRFQLAPTMGEQEVAHWFLPQDNIIDTYVVEVMKSQRLSHWQPGSASSV